MRIAVISSFLSLVWLTGCATVAPREYLDAETAATITVVAKPWTFLADGPQSAVSRREFVDVYALSVNRTGEHKQYLAVMEFFYDAASGANAPTLELTTAQSTFTLLPSKQTPRQLGVATALSPAPARETRWWFFPTSKETLATLAQSKELRTALIFDQDRISYTVFRDGNAELAALAAALP